MLEHIQLDERLIGLYNVALIMTYHNKTKKDAEDLKSINKQLNQIKTEYEELERRQLGSKIVSGMFDKFGVELAMVCIVLKKVYSLIDNPDMTLQFKCNPKIGLHPFFFCNNFSIVF